MESDERGASIKLQELSLTSLNIVGSCCGLVEEVATSYPRANVRFDLGGLCLFKRVVLSILCPFWILRLVSVLRDITIVRYIRLGLMYGSLN